MMNPQIHEFSRTYNFIIHQYHDSVICLCQVQIKEIIFISVDNIQEKKISRKIQEKETMNKQS